MPLTEEGTSNSTLSIQCSTAVNERLNSRLVRGPECPQNIWWPARERKPWGQLAKYWGKERGNWMNGTNVMFMSLNSFFFFFLMKPTSFLATLSHFPSLSSLSHTASRSTEFFCIFPYLYPLWEQESSSPLQMLLLSKASETTVLSYYGLLSKMFSRDEKILVKAWIAYEITWNLESFT